MSEENIDKNKIIRYIEDVHDFKLNELELSESETNIIGLPEVAHALYKMIRYMKKQCVETYIRTESLDTFKGRLDALKAIEVSIANAEQTRTAKISYNINEDTAKAIEKLL